ncbi:formate dehydrogenase accessory sulfurtransferase FdhD [Geomonas sp. RF6]|uniref:formate dehydrogenase accessory sulfurtransferase FdhD n=1 Tax=Geomonas sp. RF6 TaxID=2897342 RepID=UPI001E51F779|nr:formate dehydrogenase accessory sulfurtransferase FdhD [Geomonas sp. RF6]UFS68531.1 formate dehydrogenase accessory sulfurtransferase FdhD [Geomonas sp. RF6]
MSERSAGKKGAGEVFRYDGGKLVPFQHEPVQEYPLKLIVNGRELATLITSPHDLRFLVAGFLRLQGFVHSADDFHLLSVCDDYGVANVKLKGELPGGLKPVVTSGCGGGITFNLDEELAPSPSSTGGKDVYPDDIFDLMEQLARLAGAYRTSGGIHSAAVADGRTIILYSEDIGRHNTLDRIAGEALLKGIDLAGKVLLTSGRVSAEMVAKAIRLGITLIASRTSPTDLAVRLARDAGITVVGYLRGGKFNVYSHPERLSLAQRRDVLPLVTGVILAGGKSSRMESNKALLPIKGERFIERLYRQLSEVCAEVLVVTNTPEVYHFLPCRKVPDHFPGAGSLAGIHAGLRHSATPFIFAVACDMPYLNTELVRHLAVAAPGHEVVLPRSAHGYEPLHAIYARSCAERMEEALAAGERKIIKAFDWSRVQVVGEEEIREIDPHFQSFRNVNTPEEYHSLRRDEREASVTEREERQVTHR